MNQQSLQNDKELLQAWWDFLDGSENESKESALSLTTPGWCWYGFEPLNALESLEAYQSLFHIPFRKANPETGCAPAVGRIFKWSGGWNRR